jgi:hypothetical protein
VPRVRRVRQLGHSPRRRNGDRAIGRHSVIGRNARRLEMGAPIRRTSPGRIAAGIRAKPSGPSGETESPLTPRHSYAL